MITDTLASQTSLLQSGAKPRARMDQAPQAVRPLAVVLALKIPSDHRLAEQSGRRPQLRLTRKRETKEQRRSR